MKKHYQKTRCLVALSLLAGGTVALAQWNPQPGWEDSYAVDGRCYCNSSNYDHNLDSKSALTPLGELNVVQICNDIRDVLGTGPEEGRIPYNDIQCGHGPANDAADEAGCPGRVDIGNAGCDVKGPRWDLAAVYGDGDNGAGNDNPDDIENDNDGGSGDDNEVSSPILPEDTGATCAIVTMPDATLDAARAQFAEACPDLVRSDCDLTEDGRWICSTDNIDADTTAIAAIPDVETDPVVLGDPVVPSTPVDGVCEARGATLSAAIDAYGLNCPDMPRVDCDPMSDGQWTCSSGVIGNSAPGGTSSPDPQEPDTQDPPADEPTPVIPPTEEPAPVDPPTEEPGNGTVGRVGPNDLVMLHYDNCPDPDDGHAMAAGKAVIERSNLSNFLVVNGTCSDRSRNAYQFESEVVAQAVWGNQWLDSNGNEAAVIDIVAPRWATTLANGGEVWIAEGGPSDFTARVLRRIGNEFPSVDRKRIHVVQHSTTGFFNEDQTDRGNLDLIISEADYIRIPNGNAGNNGSAGFRNKSDFFVETARQSQYSNEWEAAFNYLDPNDRIDFSDTVELLYIIDETETQTIDDFARNYLQ